MRPNTTAVGVLLLAAALAVGVIWWRGGDFAPRPLAPLAGGAAGASQGPSADVDVDTARREPAREASGNAATAERDPFEAAFDALAGAIAIGRAAPAAADLRRLLRSDEAALAQAYAALLDDATDAALRRALAMVLGTLAVDGVDDVLLAALEQFAADTPTVVALIAALGALRDPPEEDDVFDMEAAPHFAVHGPGGMGITVRNVIDDPRVATALGALLLDGERRDVRLAAANAMQFSVDAEFCRTRFRTALANESDDAVAALLAQSLGLWTRRRQGGEAAEVTDELVLAAGRPGFDEYRLRLADALHEASFGALATGQLREWSQPGMPFGLKSFAWSALVAQGAADASTRGVLVTALTGDVDRPSRELAAQLLARLPAGEDSLTALRQVYDSGAEWSVRSAALVALAGLLPAEPRAALLARAAQDADARIVRRAARLR